MSAIEYVTQKEKIKALQQKLLASQASEARLREALKFYSVKARYKNGWSSRDKHVMNDKGDIARQALSTQQNIAELEAYVESEIEKFASEVKGLCQDFSSMNGNVYILDVKGAIDGLVELYAKKG